MRTKSYLCLFLAMILCLSSFTAFAAEGTTEEIVVSTEEIVDNPAEEIVAMPEDDDDGSIDYSDMSNWAYWNEGKDKAADLFFVCPTVDMGKDGNYYADITNEKYRESFVGATNMELGIYNEVATVYAPYYRQATFPVYSLSEEEREIYLDIAYQDVKNAFIYYADNADPSKPLILAGFSQGSDLLIRLMKDLFNQPKYQRRLVAAYCIGWKLTEAEVLEFPHLKPAVSETDTGVIVAFNSEDKDITSSLIIGENEKTYAINPLNWKTTSEPADKSLNKGACFTDYSGNVKQEIPNLTGAYIDEKRGALKVTGIVPEEYPGKLFENGIYHLYDYQFFFRNLQENVKTRLSAFNEKNKDRINVYYNDEIMGFDVEPVIEDGRTLVPFRAIFEVMGCAVYYTEEDGKQIVTAHRAKDNLLLTIGEDKMYFNGNEIPLDVPAKIKDDRTMVPLRAVSEAFECEVYWYEDTKTIYIYSTAEALAVRAEKISEAITDENGNVLIEVVAYYPVVDNSTNIPVIDTMNFDSKWEAEKFIEEAKGNEGAARLLQLEMKEGAFKPFVYELTFEQNYNIWGYLSFTNYKYVDHNSVHPTTTMESRTYYINGTVEMSLSEVIDEDALDVSLVKYVTNLFADKLKEMDPEGAETYTNEYVRENYGNSQFYLTKNSVVLYCNAGELAPYALGVVSVEIPYDPALFSVDMRYNYEDELVFEYEYDKGYEWQVVAYSEDKLELSEETIEYAPEEIPSELYPVGLKRITVRGIKKGNAGLVLAHVKKGEGVESATQIYISGIYIDEDNKMTLVIEDDGMFLLK